jgi:hypothetical protein
MCSSVVKQCEEAIQSLTNAIREYLKTERICVSRVRVPRTGTLGKRFVNSLLRELRSILVADCEDILSLEVFGKLVCFGYVIYPTRVTI